MRKCDGSVSIKDVVRTKGNYVAAGEDVMRATLHHAADVKIVDVKKGGNGNAENVARTYSLSKRVLQKSFDERAVGGETGCDFTRKHW